MTQALNLRRGLEAWYEFDNRYFDGGANELKDSSGNGITGDVEGGITFGVSGSDGFDSASFSGDGHIKTRDEREESPFTLFTRAKFDGDDGIQFIVGNYDGNNNGYAISQNDTEFRFTLPDEGLSAEVDTLSDIWFNAFCIHHGDAVELFVPELDIHKHGDRDEYDPDKQFDQLTIGGRGLDESSSYRMEGNIAIYAEWSRVLSQVEQQFLLKMTGPRRMML